MLTIIARAEDGHFITDSSPAKIHEYLADAHALVWVDFNQPSDEEFHLLETEFHFHPLAIEDVVRQHQRPKIDVYDGYYFLTMYGVEVKTNDALALRELDIFLGANYIVTAHKEEFSEVTDCLKRWQRNASPIDHDVGALLYLLLDTIVDGYFPLVDHVADRVEELEEKIFEVFDKNALNDLFHLKKDLLNLRRVIAPEREILNVLLRRDPPILPQTSSVYFQDVYDHIVRVTDSVDTYRDLLSSALDAFLSVQSNNLNEVMRRLTVISTIFLPLTFLTGFFGMNFQNMPFDRPAALWLSLGVMVLVPVAMLAYFRAKGWD
ncbi:MAG: magnesium/cobalt transporter CorA [Chloroflexi bacterium]|nr:magnesium/cobalt transporter CorA [Chloroflexota bacterium]